ncbi:hypothetical protein LINGRAHAP2_LOCUS32207 [Linum grandiflorum]
MEEEQVQPSVSAQNLDLHPRFNPEEDKARSESQPAFYIDDNLAHEIWGLVHEDEAEPVMELADPSYLQNNHGYGTPSIEEGYAQEVLDSMKGIRVWIVAKNHVNTSYLETVHEVKAL